MWRAHEKRERLFVVDRDALQRPAVYACGGGIQDSSQGVSVCKVEILKIHLSLNPAPRLVQQMIN